MADVVAGHVPIDIPGSWCIGAAGAGGEAARPRGDRPAAHSRLSKRPDIQGKRDLGSAGVLHAVPLRQQPSAALFPIRSTDGTFTRLSASYGLSCSAPGSGLVMPIRPLLESEAAAFGPEDLKAMTSAFEASLVALRLADRTDPAVLLVAKRVIALAKTGDRDPIRLRDEVVKSFSDGIANNH